MICPSGSRWIRLSFVFTLGYLGYDLITSAATLQIGQNFASSTFGIDSFASPADGNGAVGLDHFVEFINGRFSVYEKANGNQVETMTDLQFWSAAGVNFSANVNVTDPRVVFDPEAQRWYASMVDFSGNTARLRSNHFLLAVSKTADPTGKWNAFSLASDTNSVNFADFPTLGYDQNAVYMSGDMFDRLGNPVGPTLVVLPKSGLLASTPTISARHSFGTLSYTSHGDILQPLMSIGGGTGPELILATGDTATDGLPHTTLILSSVLNAGSGTPTLSSPSVILNVTPYTAPLEPAQPDGSNNLDDGDARFSACVRRYGTLIYATHSTEVANRAAVRWYKISATTSAIIQTGTITDPTLDLFYPSIAANLDGTVVIGCNGSSSSTFVSSYAIMGQLTNGLVKFGKPLLLKSGSGSYQNPDPTSGNQSRWGDYSATTLDPKDPTRFWTIQMIAVSDSAWATQITELLTGDTSSGGGTNGVRLAVSHSGHDLIISWPSTTDSVQLQSSPTAAPSPAWTPVPQTPDVTNNINTVVVPITTTTNEFFRLSSIPPQ